MTEGGTLLALFAKVSPFYLSPPSQPRSRLSLSHPRRRRTLDNGRITSGPACTSFVSSSTYYHPTPHPHPNHDFLVALFTKTHRHPWYQVGVYTYTHIVCIYVQLQWSCKRKHIGTVIQMIPSHSRTSPIQPRVHIKLSICLHTSAHGFVYDDDGPFVNNGESYQGGKD